VDDACGTPFGFSDNETDSCWPPFVRNNYWPSTYSCAELTADLHRLDSNYTLQVCFPEGIHHVNALCASAGVL
jgi:hypothetical protein